MTEYVNLGDVSHWFMIPKGRSIVLIVYRKGDIVMEPMNSRDVLPKNVPGVGWGWGGSCRVGWGGAG